MHGVGIPLPAGLVGAADALGLGAGQGVAGLSQLAVQLVVGQIDDDLLTAHLALADTARIVLRPRLRFLLGVRWARGDRLTHKASHRFWFWPAGVWGRSGRLWLTLTGTGVGDGFSTVDPLFSC